MLLIITLLATLFAISNAGNNGNAASAPRKNFLLTYQYNDCEGKDAANYSLVTIETRDAQCDLSSSDKAAVVSDYLIQNSDKKNTQVNILQNLAASIYPAGAYTQLEKLSLVVSGPLQGKYTYGKDIYLDETYLKKCSSILGYSYVTTKSSVFLISDKLDLNVLLSPTGAFDAFKKGCTTVCTGTGYFV